MIEAETLKSIATQLMTSTSVSVEGKSIPVGHTSRRHLRTAAFSVGGREYQARRAATVFFERMGKTSLITPRPFN